MLRRRSLSFLSSLSPAGALAALGVPAVLAIGLAGGCGDDTVTPPDDDGPQPPTLRPGDLCNTPQSNLVKVRFSPLQVFLPACTGEDCTTRKVKAIVDPDFCVDTPVTFTSSDEAKLPAPAAGSVTLYQSEVSFDLPGATEPGRYTLTASVPKGNGEDATATLDVVVLDPSLPTCAGTADDSELTEGETLLGSGELAGASIGLPEGANKPNERQLPVERRAVRRDLDRCGDDLTPDGYVALGPADHLRPREPSRCSSASSRSRSRSTRPLLPAAARWRHLRDRCTRGPAFKEPRTIPVADPRIEQIGRGSGRCRSRRRGSAPTRPSCAPTRARARSAAHHPPRRHRRVDGRRGTSDVRYAPPRSLRRRRAARRARRLDVDAAPHREQPPRRASRRSPGHAARGHPAHPHPLRGLDRRATPARRASAHRHRARQSVHADAHADGPYEHPSDVQHVVGTSTRGRQRRQLPSRASTRRSSATSRSCSATPTARTCRPAPSTCPRACAPTIRAWSAITRTASAWSGSIRSTDVPTRRAAAGDIANSARSSAAPTRSP
jgi:hypothetical protein